MECPECGNKTRVTNSRKYAGAVYRQRICKSCRFKFWTEEIEIDSDSQIIIDVNKFVEMKYRNKK